MDFVSYLWPVAVFGWLPLIYADELASFFSKLKRNPIALEVAAESSIHVSTYGAIFIGFFVGDAEHHLFGWRQIGATAAWFMLFHVVSYNLRKLLHDLNKKAAPAEHMA